MLSKVLARLYNSLIWTVNVFKHEMVHLMPWTALTGGELQRASRWGNERCRWESMKQTLWKDFCLFTLQVGPFGYYYLCVMFTALYVCVFVSLQNAPCKLMCGNTSHFSGACLQLSASRLFCIIFGFYSFLEALSICWLRLAHSGFQL